MTILLRLPDSVQVVTLERALRLLGLRLSQQVATMDGERCYTAVDPLARPERPDPTCKVCGASAPVLVGREYFCVAHWQRAKSEVVT